MVSEEEMKRELRERFERLKSAKRGTALHSTTPHNPSPLQNCIDVRVTPEENIEIRFKDIPDCAPVRAEYEKVLKTALMGGETIYKTLSSPHSELEYEVVSVGSDFVHDKLVAEGWKPLYPIPRLEEALKKPGGGGSSSPELAVEMARRKFSPERYEYKVVKHYALAPHFPYMVFVRERG